MCSNLAKNKKIYAAKWKYMYIALTKTKFSAGGDYHHTRAGCMKKSG